MLFNTSVLKRLMKYAYKGWGLTVGLDAVRICPGPEPEQMAYVISGKNWTVNILQKFVPKEIKAVIMECAGELPEEGRFFTCYKKELTNYAFNEVYVPPCAETIGNDVEAFDVSRLSIGDRRIVRVGVQTVVFENMFLDLLHGEIDEQNGETELMGRFYSGGDFYFWNNTCFLRAGEAGKTETEKTILSNLKYVDIFGEHIKTGEENGAEGSKDDP